MTQSKEPEKWYDREVNLTPGNLAKLSVSTFLLNPYGALSSFVDIVNHSPTSELIWSLVKEALAQSIKTVLKESRGSLTEAPDADKFDGDIKNKLKDSPVRLEPDFFANPRKMVVLHKVKEAFVVFLQRHGLNQNEAETMAARLDSTFVKALHSEYAKSTEKYSRLKDILDSPFLDASLDEQRWELYRERLIVEADEAVFGDVFSLQQIYIPLRAYYRKKDSPRFYDSPEDADAPDTANIVISLDSHVEQWLASDESTVCMISGGPGSGKSSFTKMLAKKQAEQGKQVLRVPLHELNLDTSSYIQSLGEHVRQKLGLSENPLDQVDEARPLLLILDGLDELTRQGETTSSLASRLLESIEREAANRNDAAGKAVWKVLVSGRPIVTQQHRGHWKSRNPLELYFLPYYITEEQRHESKLFGDASILKHDQRLDWWKKFAEFKNRDFEEISRRLSELSSGSIAEITGQPLLNYLVARLHSELNIDPGINLNNLYETLIESVHERNWDKSGNVHLQGTIDTKQFLEALETVALAAWHSGDTRSATYETVMECKENFRRQVNLEDFREGAKAGFTRLLTAFYFRTTNTQNNREQFEFTHKSFGDYLVARILVDEFSHISKKLADRSRDGWKFPDALKHWAKLCGPTMMSPAILDFLRQEIRLRAEKDFSDEGSVSVDKLRQWHKDVTHLLSEALYEGTPIHELESLRGDSYVEMARQVRNAEESLLAMHSAIANVTRQRGNIFRVEDTYMATFKRWLMRLQGHIQGTATSVLTTCLNDLSLSRCEMQRAELDRASFVRTDLIGADLRWADLRWADLSGADLHAADLSGSDLHGANLNGADLSGSDLTEADLHGANLNGADLRKADLSSADLSGVGLIGADLSEANLDGADLSSAYFSEAHFSETNLSRAELLEKARLMRGSLEEVEFNIKDFEVKGAIVQDTED